MAKLSINKELEIEYDVIDCTDKIAVLKVPIFINKEQKHAVDNIAELFKSLGAKDAVIIPEYVSFKLRTIDKTIHILNKLIKKLDSDKRKLERMGNKYNE